MRSLGLLLCLFFWVASVCAKEPAVVVPAPLLPWKEWVLYEHKVSRCLPIYNQLGEQRICAWPTPLLLSLNQTGGTFNQTWQLDEEGWLSLPGDETHWPQEVQVNGKAATVSLHEDAPAIFLGAGQYRISGRFIWTEMPDELALPEVTSLISLKIDNKEVLFPQVEQGSLLLHDAHQTDAVENRHTLTVYRRVVDDIPTKLVTRLDLNVSGEARTLTLGPVLLPDTIPLQLVSDLPLKIEQNGLVTIQVRPGQWHIELTSRFSADVQAIALPQAGETWVGDEIWVFEEHSNVRKVEVTGVAQIDPRQTTLPADWHKFPAYRMSAGQTMKLELRRRGNPDAAANKLTLHRKIWLDFDGLGYTVQDTIGGTMSQGWRLAMAAPYNLGRVVLNGDDQVITRTDANGAAGVEIRNSQLNLQAESRVENGEFAHLGWRNDFNQASGQLLLPAGYSVFSMSGVDEVSASWFKRWSLLDIFLTLIITLAIAKLWNSKVAAVAALLLLLTWHEPDAPRWIWLNIVVAVALWRVLPDSKIKTLVQYYRWASMAILLLMAVAYAVTAVRQGLYPHLEQQPQRAIAAMQMADFPADAEGDAVPAAAPAAPAAVQENVPAAPAPEAVMDSVVGLSKHREEKTADKRYEQYGSTPQASIVDPNAKRQTGPGLPNWHGQTVQFSWNGPVKAGQDLGIILISPTLHLCLNLLSVVLMGVLMLRLADFAPRLPSRVKTQLSSMLLLGLLATVSYVPDDAWANEPANLKPDEALLAELRKRLIKELDTPPECSPVCAVSSRAYVQVSPDELRINMEIHAQADVAIPLPMAQQQWLAQEVLLDGKAAAGIYLKEEQSYVPVKKGVHQLSLRGKLPPVSSISIPLPLNPYHIQSSAQGWLVQGIEAGKVSGQLQLVRQQSKSSADSNSTEVQALPPFVLVERTISLGVEWSVETVVSRVSSDNSTIVLEIPLLAGESVLSDNTKVKQGKAQVTLAGGQADYRWHSSLEKNNKLTLQAPVTTQWLEHWRLNPSTIWRVSYQGLPEILNATVSPTWTPEWWPWPNEKLQLDIIRPNGIEGQTLTVDQTTLNLAPGNRVANVSYQMQLRSSQGEQRQIPLPEGAELQSLTIDGVAQAVQPKLKYIPLSITPGNHTINIEWLQADGISTLYRSPALNTGIHSVNNNIKITIPRDRWILFTGGPSVGPAVLFWGVLIVIILVAFAAGRSGYTPLKTWQWVLLGIGLSQLDIWMIAIVASWFFVLAYRAKQPPSTPRRFNFLQLFIILLTLLATIFLFSAVWQGLLGSPEMQIRGNGSWDYNLAWYQDRATGLQPQAWVLTVPLFAYRLLMLLWSLWLAFSLLKWLKWGWQAFSTEGLWRKRVKAVDGEKKGGA